jgi:hypothetical protein
MRKKGREEIKREWCERVLITPTEIIEQNDGSYRMWGFILEEGKYLRVIVLPDRETVDTHSWTEPTEGGDDEILIRQRRRFALHLPP